VVPLTIN